MTPVAKADLEKMRAEEAAAKRVRDLADYIAQLQAEGVTRNAQCE
jgi:hypothetical protein